MLVLSRARNQITRITVPPSDREQVIDVVLVRIASSKVRLGFTADRCVSIHRDDMQNDRDVSETEQPQRVQ